MICLVIFGIAGCLSPTFAQGGKKSGKKTPPTKPPIQLTYIHDGKFLGFTTQPKVTPGHICNLVNPGDESVHVIRLMDEGKIRVYQGNENLVEGPHQVSTFNENDTLTSVLPGTSTPVEVFANYSWAYDNRGMLTLYNGAPGEGRAIYRFNFVVTSDKNPGGIMFQGIYTPRPGAKAATLVAEPAKFKN